MKNPFLEIEKANHLVTNRDYKNAAKLYFEILNNNANHETQTKAITALNNLKQHLQSASFKAFEETVQQEKDGYITPMMITDAVDGIRGVVSLEEKKRKDLLFSIPMSLIVTQFSSIDSAWGKQLQDKNISFKFDAIDVYVVLSIILKIQNEPNHILANQDNWMEKNSCLYWENETIEQLQGSHLQQEVHELQKDIQSDFKALTTVIPEFSKFCDFERFRCLMSQTISRCISINIDGIEHVCMIPLGDCLNHATHPNADWIYNEYTHSFDVYALKDIKPGESITISYYRDPANADLLLDYGFCLEQNKNDYLILENGIFLYHDPTHPDFVNLWQKDLEFFLNSYQCDGFTAQLHLCRLVLNKIQKKLKNYKHSIEDDEKWMANHTFENKNYFIRKALLLEKKLLYQWIDVCQIVTQSASMPREQQLELIGSWSEVTQGPKLYLKEYWAKEIEIKKQIT